VSDPLHTLRFRRPCKFKAPDDDDELYLIYAAVIDHKMRLGHKTNWMTSDVMPQ